MAKAALMVGGDPNAPEQGIAHAIEIAASMADTEMIDLLLEADSYPTEGAVEAAVMQGHNEVAESLRKARIKYTGEGPVVGRLSVSRSEKRRLVTEFLGTYGVVFVADHGKQPSKHTISYWIQKLMALQPADIVRLGRSPEGLKRFLESGNAKGILQW